MNEKQKLYQQIKEYKKHLGKLRLKWFISIWLGYSAVILYVLCPHGFSNIVDFAKNLFVALVLGVLGYYVNLIVWSNCYGSLRDGTKYLEELEKKYNNMN